MITGAECVCHTDWPRCRWNGLVVPCNVPSPEHRQKRSVEVESRQKHKWTGTTDIVIFIYFTRPVNTRPAFIINIQVFWNTTRDNTTNANGITLTFLVWRVISLLCESTMRNITILIQFHNAFIWYIRTFNIFIIFLSIFNAPTLSCCLCQMLNYIILGLQQYLNSLFIWILLCLLGSHITKCITDSGCHSFWCKTKNGEKLSV